MTARLEGEEIGTLPEHLEDPRDALVEVGLEAEEIRDALARSRRASLSELFRAIVISATALVALGFDAWVTLRGDSGYGWLLFALLTGFAARSWSRWRQGEAIVADLEESLRLLEETRASEPPTRRPA